MLRRVVLALVAGVVLSLAFEPVAAPWVLPFAVAGYVLSVHGLSPRRGWIPGLVFGVGFYFVHIVWMRAVATAAWIALAGIEALFYGLLGSAVAALVVRRRWPLWCAAAWVTMEVWRSQWPFSGMPWGRLAFAVVDTPVERSLPYVGMVGVSLLLALAGMLLAWLVLTTGPRRAGVLGLAGLVLALAVPAVHPYHLAQRGTATVAAVQGDVPGPGNDVLYDFRQVTANHVDATVGLAARVGAGEVPRPDFVVWPENSTAVDPFSDALTREGIDRAVAAIDEPVLVGAIVDGGPKYAYNQGIVYTPGQGAGERYTKRHPVPYGEYIPMRSLFNAQFGQLARISRDMLPGTRRTPLTIAGVKVADALCFDIAYDDVVRDQMTRGAQMLTVQTSNATFIFTHQVEQQFAMTRLRAIETGKWTVVASTNGISGVIDPQGDVVQRAEKRTTAVLVQQVGLSPGATPAMHLGLWIGRMCIGATLLGLLLVTVAYRRDRRLRSLAPGTEEGMRA